MKKIPNVTQAEWVVMKTLWDEHPLTGNEVARRLASKRHWKPKTVKTLLARLVTKEAVAYDQRGREYHYYPLLAEELCKEAASQSFLKTIFNGAVKPMLATILDSHRLSDEDIAELKALLDEKRRD